MLDQQIKPPVENLEVFRVVIEPASGRFVLVVQIPAAELEPHMAPDSRYYRRRGAKNWPMSHHEVRDAFFRARYPRLRLEFELDEVTIMRATATEFTLSVRHRLALRNLGRVIATNYLATVVIDRAVYSMSGPNFARVSGSPTRTAIRIQNMCVMEDTDFRRARVPVSVPLFPSGAIDAHGTLTCRHEDLEGIEGHRCEWEIYADSAPAKQGRFELARLLPRGLTKRASECQIEVGKQVQLPAAQLDWPGPLYIG